MENQMTESRQRMTSLEIAEVTGKPHNDVMKAIRKMEPAWVRTCQGKFSLTSRMVQQPNGGAREVPCYSLTKTECLYVATKFNDEARAKLVLRWEELEHERIARQEKMSDLEIVCRALMIQKRQIEEKDKLIEVLQPRADYCDEVLDSIDCMTMTQVAKGEGMTVHELTNLLLQKGIIYCQSGCYMLYAKYADKGLAAYRTHSHRDLFGSMRTNIYLVWTERGRKFIHEIIDHDDDHDVLSPLIRGGSKAGIF